LGFGPAFNPPGGAMPGSFYNNALLVVLENRHQSDNSNCTKFGNLILRKEPVRLLSRDYYCEQTQLTGVTQKNTLAWLKKY